MKVNWIFFPIYIYIYIFLEREESVCIWESHRLGDFQWTDQPEPLLAFQVAAKGSQVWKNLP